MPDTQDKQGDAKCSCDGPSNERRDQSVEVEIGREKEVETLRGPPDLILLLNRRLVEERNELKEKNEALRQSKRLMESRICELQDTASALTEWNSTLEQHCMLLSESLQEERGDFAKDRYQLQQDLLTSTSKRIDLQEELDSLDSENVMLKKSLKEHLDIQQRLSQENAILKSKLYDVLLRGEIMASNRSTNDSPEGCKLFLSPEQCQAMGHILKSAPINDGTFTPFFPHTTVAPRLETIDLEDRLSLEKILDQLRLSAIVNRR